MDITKREVASSLAEEIGGDSEEEAVREQEEYADNDEFKYGQHIHCTSSIVSN